MMMDLRQLRQSTGARVEQLVHLICGSQFLPFRGELSLPQSKRGRMTGANGDCRNEQINLGRRTNLDLFERYPTHFAQSLADASGAAHLTAN
jgi:hypothetical protein